jgi:hypothetical protein
VLPDGITGRRGSVAAAVKEERKRDRDENREKRKRWVESI